jgi:hypothetical protein
VHGRTTMTTYDYLNLFILVALCAVYVILRLDDADRKAGHD